MTIIDGRNAAGDDVRIVIEGGTVRAVYSDALAPVLEAIGSGDVTRVSNVEPYDGSGGEPFAARYPGVWWTAAMVDGPVLGPFKTRAEALTAELAWLRAERGL